MAAVDLTTQITDGANGPASVSNDGQSVTDRSIREKIEADQYLNLRAVLGTRRLGIVMRKLLPSGAMCDKGGSLLPISQPGFPV